MRVKKSATVKRSERTSVEEEKGKERLSKREKREDEKTPCQRSTKGEEDEFLPMKGEGRTEQRPPAERSDPNLPPPDKGWMPKNCDELKAHPSPVFHFQASEAATSEPSHFGQCFTSSLDANSGTGRDEEKKGVSELPPHFGVEHVLGWVESRLDFFSNELCKVTPSGKVYPLPTSSAVLARTFPQDSAVVLKCLRALVASLNSYNGEGVFCEREPSAFQIKVLANLKGSVKHVLNWDETCKSFSWSDFWKIKGVDYRGEEVQTAQQISWASVESALPREVGGVDLETVVELGSKHYVTEFDQYLLDKRDQVYVKPPRVMVAEGDWDLLCEKLMECGVFSKIHEDDLYRVSGKPVLNGLFGVSKQEYTSDGVEVMRVIMNMTPLNALCRTFDSDISTLPTWATMSPLELSIDEDLVISSEDVRCFFYIFKIPPLWFPYMAFNRPLCERLSGNKPGRWYPCSAVLPMAFKNSVALAQHIHRVLAKGALSRCSMGGELEARKDRPFSSGNPLFRIYLDNFDELRRVSKTAAEIIEGHVSPLVSSLREEYQLKNVPRHPKKAVASQYIGEVQGAIVNGKEGIIFPKPAKVFKYAFLVILLLQSGRCTQKQAQIVAGGLVYLAMFRRPLLGSLHHIWRFITSFENLPPVIKLELPQEVQVELTRFLGLIPLAYMNLRHNMSPVVTASDASTTGGGITVSSRLTPAGCVAAQCTIRGDVVEPMDVTQVLTVGLFDGIGGLRSAADLLGWNAVGHISVESSAEANRVVESRFPNTEMVADVKLVTPELVETWALKFSQVSVVVLGAGPPCQGVSG
eukprot:Skav211711  [mRNA]  locus=scaffold2852:255903:258329:- [translate_table: standard]